MNSMTTAMGKNFTTENITFRHARKQSEIDNEIEKEEVCEEEVKAPVSLTPEQVMDFYKTKISKSVDSNEKRLYSQTIRWIKELQSTKKELLILKEKEIIRNAEDEEVEDIEEDNVGQ